MVTSLPKIDPTIRSILEKVMDPEIPVLSIMDMGIVRGIEQDGKKVKIKITPTYTGCPAMDMIATEIKIHLDVAGYNTEVELILSPAWSTDWLTVRGRKALEDYGIAAPLNEALDKRALMGESNLVKCTNCGSTDTILVSEFGSTACKSLFKCQSCLEPFDYFKCLK